MNIFDDQSIEVASFAYNDLLGLDKWYAWTPVFTGITLVGGATYVGRRKMVGKQCFFQVTLVAATSIATTAGTTYFALPKASTGIAGAAVMTNGTTKIAVGLCHIDSANARCYLPTQGASGNTFTVAGWYQV